MARIVCSYGNMVWLRMSTAEKFEFAIRPKQASTFLCLRTLHVKCVCVFGLARNLTKAVPIYRPNAKKSLSLNLDTKSKYENKWLWMIFVWFAFFSFFIFHWIVTPSLFDNNRQFWGWISTKHSFNKYTNFECWMLLEQWQLNTDQVKESERTTES